LNVKVSYCVMFKWFDVIIVRPRKKGDEIKMLSKYYSKIAEIADRYRIEETVDGVLRIKPDEDTSIFLKEPFKVEADEYTVTIRKGNKWLMLWKGVNHALLEI
jgi:helix-turn-helix protein